MEKLWAYVRGNTTTYEYGETEEIARAKFREPFELVIKQQGWTATDVAQAACEKAWETLEYLKACQVEFIGEVCTNPDCEFCLANNDDDESEED